LDLHCSLASFQSSSIKEDQLQEIKIWLEKLLDVNDQSKLYDSDAFAYMAGKYWYRVCDIRQRPSLKAYNSANKLLRFSPGYTNLAKFYWKEIKKLFTLSGYKNSAR